VLVLKDNLSSLVSRSVSPSTYVESGAVHDIGWPQPGRGCSRPADFGQSGHGQEYQHRPVDGRPEVFFVQASIKMTAALL
jgi:hypothetical protein